jgi:hypothetical protein
MLSDPQSITISGSATSLPKTSQGPGTGTFTSADTAISEVISHSYGKRVRRVARLNISKISTDVLIPSQNARSAASMSVVFDVPVNGYSVAEIKAAWDGFAAQLAASSGAMVTQILGGQN